jgi:NhaP-type Na+/H+ or K+/H+ antiporter
METDIMIGLTSIVVFGVGAQWLAAQLRVPAILLLLAAGVIAGPVTGLVVPDKLFGELTFPFVSLAVGLLLFEGGLSLRLDGFNAARSTVVRLVTVGVVVTWFIGAAAAVVLFRFPVDMALLVSSVLVVSGPTVVIPLLRQARPAWPVGQILRWEGIVIDPIGATLAVLVLHVVIGEETGIEAFKSLLRTTSVGISVGVVAALVLTTAISTFRLPDHLQNPIALLFALVSFTLAHQLQDEAGLFATTTLGLVLGNQRTAPASHIALFQEEIGPLLLSTLFVILGAHVDLGEVANVALPAVVFSLVLLLIARPAAVWMATVGSGLTRPQWLYLAAIAPRGIVAASVASLFALRLEHAGRGLDQLVPIVFTVICVTVLVASLCAMPLARRLGVAKPQPNGIVLVGSQRWVLDIASALAEMDVKVLIASAETDQDYPLPSSVEVFAGSLSSDEFFDQLDECGISQAVVASANPERSAYAINRLVEALGHRQVYSIPQAEEERTGRRGAEYRARGRRAFASNATQAVLHDQLAAGASLEWNDADKVPPEPGQLVLFVINAAGHVSVHPPNGVGPMVGSCYLSLLTQERSEPLAGGKVA